MNENLIAVAVLLASFGASYLNIDDGSLLKMVVSAYLGLLVGKRLPAKK